MARYLCFFFLLFTTIADAQVFAGFHEVDITPSIMEGKRSCFGGYGAPFQRCDVDHSTSEINLSALVLMDWDTQLILVSIDIVGISDSLIADIKAATRKLSRGRIQPESILVTATHNHSGPDLQGLWGGVSHLYKKRVVESAARSILSAFNSRTAVKFYTGLASAKVENRRGWDLVDSEINILDIRSTFYGHRVATLVNMSAHPTIIDETNFTWNADYVGYMREVIDRELNTSSFFINGIVGDAQPATNEIRGIEMAKTFGEQTGLSVVKAMKKARPLLAKNFSYEEVPFSHPIENPIILTALALGLINVDRDEEGNALTQYGMVSIGQDFSAIVFPGEALSRLGIPIKQGLMTQHKMFWGLTGDTLGYFIPSDEFGAIDGRLTEEIASLSSKIGDAFSNEFFCFYVGTGQCD